jgi:hypothetical protein
MTCDAQLVMGRPVRLPLRIREAEALFASYLVPVAGVHALLGGSGLEAARLLPGKGLCSIIAVRYIDGDLGPYQEIAVAFFVRQPVASPRRRSHDVFQFLRRTLGTYVYQLPVTEELAREAGIRIWGFPKWLGRISVQLERRTSRCALHCGDKHVLSLSVRNPLPLPFREQEMVTYTRKDGSLHRVRWLAGGEGFGLRPGGATLTLGDHPIGEDLKTLGLPKPALFSGRARRVHATFHSPERTDGARSGEPL